MKNYYVVSCYFDSGKVNAAIYSKEEVKNDENLQKIISVPELITDNCDRYVDGFDNKEDARKFYLNCKNC